eukprot:1199718-Pleurochrysis_carterae.AAC.2
MIVQGRIALLSAHAAPIARFVTLRARFVALASQIAPNAMSESGLGLSIRLFTPMLQRKRCGVAGKVFRPAQCAAKEVRHAHATH